MPGNPKSIHAFWTDWASLLWAHRSPRPVSAGADKVASRLMSSSHLKQGPLFQLSVHTWVRTYISPSKEDESLFHRLTLYCCDPPHQRLGEDGILPSKPNPRMLGGSGLHPPHLFSRPIQGTGLYCKCYFRSLPSALHSAQPKFSENQDNGLKLSQVSCSSGEPDTLNARGDGTVRVLRGLYHFVTPCTGGASVSEGTPEELVSTCLVMGHSVTFLLTFF